MPAVGGRTPDDPPVIGLRVPHRRHPRHAGLVGGAEHHVAVRLDDAPRHVAEVGHVRAPASAAGEGKSGSTPAAPAASRRRAYRIHPTIEPIAVTAPAAAASPSEASARAPSAIAMALPPT